MDKEGIIRFCKDLGCCDACCIRYCGIHKPLPYENCKQYILKRLNQLPEGFTPATTSEESKKSNILEGNGGETSNNGGETSNNGCEANGAESPPAKKQRGDVCVSCLGVLQENSWLECYNMVKEQLDKKRYSCSRFACALSAPIATMLREHYIMLLLAERFSNYDQRLITPLKEAWKWSFGSYLSRKLGKVLDSGAVCPLLITVTIEYADDLQELEILKTISPSLFESRSKERKRFAVEFTRRSVEEALYEATVDKMKTSGGIASPTGGIARPTTGGRCVSAICCHSPVYLGGRYIKLSRSLPQTPWLVNGKRMMESSVQEIIFKPIADLYVMSPEECEHRLKFMSAGREDVDVRCLGDGRPFAIEITDPRRDLNSEELHKVCEDINSSGSVVVKLLVPVTREDLAQLKQGEQSKTKTYDALCIKRTHGEHDIDKEGEPKVTEKDLELINQYRNTPEESDARIQIVQKTPIRVLHRRPLLSRNRKIYDVEATAVPEYPQLFKIRLVTEAGTYVKEWCHGDFRRTTPSLLNVISATTDLLALDVTAVSLQWPPEVRK